MQKPAAEEWRIEPEMAVSRNFEILKRAHRTDELFGPSRTEIVRAAGPSLVPLNARSGTAMAPLPEFVLSRSSQEILSNSPGLPVELSGKWEDWRQLLRYLFPLQNSALCCSVGICAVKQDASAASFIAMLGRHLNEYLDSSFLLVEAGFQGPSLARIFGVQAKPGLGEMLLDPARPASDCWQKSRFDNLWILPAGGAGRPRDLADLERGFRRVYETAAAQFRYLIIELPPVSEKQNLLFPYALVDAVVLLVRPNSVGVRELQGAIRRLADARANVVGTILNDLEPWPAAGSNGSWWGRIRSILGSWRAG